MMTSEGDELEEEKKCVDQDVYNLNGVDTTEADHSITNDDDETDSLAAAMSPSAMATIEKLKKQVEELEAKNQILQKHNDFLERENTDLQTTVDSLNQRFITLMEEKLTLQTTMDSLEHKVMEDIPLESEEFTDPDDNNWKTKASISSRFMGLKSKKKDKSNEPASESAEGNDSTATTPTKKTGWGILGDALTPKSKKDVIDEPQGSMPPMPAPPPESILPIPVPPSVDDSSQAEILKHTIAQQKKKKSENSWSFSFGSGSNGNVVGGLSASDLSDPNVDNCKKQFEQFKRLSTLSDVRNTLEGIDGDSDIINKEERLLNHIHEKGDELNLINDCERSVGSDVACIDDYGMDGLDDHDDNDDDQGESPMRKSSNSTSSRNSQELSKRSSMAWGRLFGNKKGDTNEEDDFDSHDVIDKQRLSIHSGRGGSTRTSQEGARLSVHHAALLE